MKKSIIFFVLFICNLDLFSQTGLDDFGRNELKYWKLRGRLTGDDNNKDVFNGFMTVGGGNGNSIPADLRMPTSKRNSYYFDPDGECNLQEINGVSVYSGYTNGMVTGTPIIDPRDGQDVKGILKFSDNSIINIGNYLGILATEWALLHRKGANTLQTERELYYALLALDRLDLNGESIYNLSPSLNGFLMRTDVDEMFQLNTSGKNIDLVTAPIACKNTSSDCSESNATNHSPNAMSQDEVIGMLLGVALIRKMLPYYVEYNGVGLRQWSREIAQRIVYYTRSGGTTNFWAIVDPDEKKRVCRGSKAIFNSYAIAATMQYISDNITQNGWSMSIGKFAWKIKKNTYAMNNFDVAIFLGMPTQMQTNLNLNAYEYIDIPGTGPGQYDHDGAYNISMFLKLLSTSFTAPRPIPPYFDFTGKALINTVSQTYLKDLYELVGSVIYGYYPQHTESYWRTQFNNLNCGCNCIQGTDAVSYYGCKNYFSYIPGQNAPETVDVPGEWGVPDRWAMTHKYGGSHAANGDDAGTFEEYNGMDYMLAYNLYRWKYFAAGYEDRVRLNWDKDFPFLSLPNPYDNNNQYQLGSTQYPFNVKSVFSINATNTINSSAKIQYIAGSDVKLSPGFFAKPGSVFRAQVKEMDCEPNIIDVPNAQNISWKNGDYNENFDSLVNIQLDGDSIYLYDEGDDIDSFYVLTYTNNTDTFYYDLHPDYVYDDSGNIVYAPAFNRQALQDASINSIVLYPNPTSTKAFLEYTLYQESDVKIEINNELGQVMSGVIEQAVHRQQKGKQKITLNTANLSSGVYFCMVELNGRREVLKFTVLK